MSFQDPSHGDPLRSLEDRADALERRTARPVPGAGNRAVDQAYKIIAELLGGAIVGLGLGFGVDRLTGRTAPWGLIGGVLVGFAVSIWMAKRTADRLSAQATSEAAPAASAVVRTQDEDEA